MVEHTYRVLAAVERFRNLIDDAETGQRGYLLTGDDRYLAPYSAALSSIDGSRAKLRDLMAGHPEQQARLAALDEATAAKLAELRQTIELRRTRGFPAALEVVRTDRGKQAMDEIRRIADKVLEEEHRILAPQRLSEAEAQLARSMAWGAVNGLAILGLLTLLTIAVERNARQLERRVAERTGELAESNQKLESANKELESFAYSVSHDLRAPLRSVDSFSQIVLEEYSEKLDEDGVRYLRRVRAGAQHMGQLIDALLNLSRVSRAQLKREPVHLSSVALSVVNELRDGEPTRTVNAEIAPNIQANCDAGLLRVVMDNLIGNAWKFTGKRERACLEFGVNREEGDAVYYIRDNGAGFDMAYAAQLFAPFQRLHQTSEFAGTGIGLATVQRIIQRHGGRIWAKSAVEEGATFYFTLGGESDPNGANGRGAENGKQTYPTSGRQSG
jgi:signal transduction histidine kinase